MPREITRRRFLAETSAATIALATPPLVTRAMAAAPLGANDRIRVGVIGTGVQGLLHLQTYSGMQGVDVCALCDVSEVALSRALKVLELIGASRPQCYTDIRILLEDPHIDAVSIATPTHWHALMAIWACQSGKDCYVESPCSKSFFEGRQLVAAAKRFGRIVQHGSAGQPHDNLIEDSLALSSIGSVNRVRTAWFGASPAIPQPDSSVVRDKDLLDLWFGPSDAVRLKAETDRTRQSGLHILNDSLGSAIGSLQTGLNLLDAGFPSLVSTLSTKVSPSGIENSHMAIHLDFQVPENPLKTAVDFEVLPKALLPLRANALGSEKNGKFAHCEALVQTTASGGRGEVSVEGISNSHRDTRILVENFIKAVRTRDARMLASPIEQGHLACGSMHLANISLALKRSLSFNVVTQDFDNDADAEALLQGHHRHPYTIPKIP